MFYEIIFEVLESLLNIALINKLKLILFIFDLRFEDWHVKGSVYQVYMFDVLYTHKWARMVHSSLIDIYFAEVMLSYILEGECPIINLSNDTRVKPLRLRAIVTHNWLIDQSRGYSNMYRELNFLHARIQAEISDLFRLIFGHFKVWDRWTQIYLRHHDEFFHSSLNVQSGNAGSSWVVNIIKEVVTPFNDDLQAALTSWSARGRHVWDFAESPVEKDLRNSSPLLVNLFLNNLDSRLKDI